MPADKVHLEEKTTKIKAALFLSGLSGLSIIGGFSYALAASKKGDPQVYDHGINGTKKLPMVGTSLALRALGWGSLYAVSGVTLFCYAVWKLSGAKDMQEFRKKIGLILPQIPKVNNHKGGRTEFDSLSDLLKYIIESDKCKKDTIVNSQNSKDQT